MLLLVAPNVVRMVQGLCPTGGSNGNLGACWLMHCRCTILTTINQDKTIWCLLFRHVKEMCILSHGLGQPLRFHIQLVMDVQYLSSYLRIGLKF